MLNAPPTTTRQANAGWKNSMRNSMLSYPTSPPASHFNNLKSSLKTSSIPLKNPPVLFPGGPVLANDPADHIEQLYGYAGFTCGDPPPPPVAKYDLTPHLGNRRLHVDVNHERQRAGLPTYRELSNSTCPGLLPWPNDPDTHQRSTTQAQFTIYPHVKLMQHRQAAHAQGRFTPQFNRHKDPLIKIAEQQHLMDRTRKMLS